MRLDYVEPSGMLWDVGGREAAWTKDSQHALITSEASDLFSFSFPPGTKLLMKGKAVSVPHPV